MDVNDGLTCRDLDFSWPDDRDGKQPVLQSVTATFPAGTISLITGQTGAGKSTLLHLLAGLMRPTAGEVWADGRPVSRWPASHRDVWRRQVGVVLQHLAVMPDLTVAENLLPPLLPQAMAWPRMQACIHRQLIEADLAGLADQPARRLSGGQRQRLALARALIAEPRFILADEPTAFQDDEHAGQILDRLHAAVVDGAVVVLCSQDPRLRRAPRIDQHLHLSAGVLRTDPLEGHAL